VTFPQPSESPRRAQASEPPRHAQASEPTRYPEASEPPGYPESYGAAAPDQAPGPRAWPPYDAPAYQPVPERRSRWAALGTFAVVAVSGLALGWLWTVVAPRLLVIKAEGGAFLYAETEPEQPIAGEGWFAIIGASAGVLFAVLAWVLLRRYRGLAVLLALTVGSIAAAVLAAWLGYRIGHAQFVAADQAAAVGDRINGPLVLAMTGGDPQDTWRWRPTGVLAVQALFAALTYTFLAGFSPYLDLRGEPTQFGPGVTGSSESGIGTARS
jgi:hypothetical protein